MTGLDPDKAGLEPSLWATGPGLGLPPRALQGSLQKSQEAGEHLSGEEDAPLGCFDSAASFLGRWVWSQKLRMATAGCCWALSEGLVLSRFLFGGMTGVKALGRK